jgi:CBS domain containing-hemolysin-like protein
MFLEIPILVLLLGCSAFLSGAETALFNLSASQRAQFASTGSRLQRAAAELIQKPDRLILTLLLGNMTVNVAFFALSSLMVIRTARHLAAWQSTLLGLVPLLAIIVLGEIIPKALALNMPAAVAAAVALPLRTLHAFLTPALRFLQLGVIAPLVRLLAPARGQADPAVTHEELRALLESSCEQGVLDLPTSTLLTEVVELASIKVREIMIPRTDIRAYDLNAPRARLLKLIRRERLGFIPVYDHDLDHILGVVASRDVLLNPDQPIKTLLREVVYVPEIITVDALLDTLRTRGRKLAITVDEYGGTAGLITIEDVVEQIVGELRDAPLSPGTADQDQPEPVQQIGPDTYLLAGSLSIRSWAEAFRMSVGSQRVATLAGFITASLGRLPAEGDTVRLANLTLTVRKVRGRRVTQIELSLDRNQPDHPEEPA